MTRIILLLLLSIQLLSCEKESANPNQNPETLIYSTSFEDQTTLEEEGWEGVYTLLEDSPASGGSYCLALEPQWLPGLGEAFYAPTLSNNSNYRIDFWFKTINWEGIYTLFEDSPASGGSYCLALEPQWLPGLGEAFYAPTLSNNGNYRIDFWFKTINWEGSFRLNKRLSGSDAEENLLTIALTNEDWTFASHSFVLELAENETLVVYFSAGGTEVVSGKVLVDELSIYRE